MTSGNYTVRILPIVDDKKLREQLEKYGTKSAEKSGKAMGKSMGKGIEDGMNKPLKNAEGAIGTLGAAMKRKLSYSTFTYATKALKGMVNAVRELDKAQTQLSKVTDLQGKTMEEFTDRAFEAGKTVARTGTEMVSSATLFAQAGMKDQALELGRVATMYQNIADEEVSINDATGMIVATMKAFDMSSVDDAMGIINVINEVSNNFAVSSSDLATNINKSTAAAKNAGMTYDELVTSMAGMIEITRSGAKASRAVVTLSSRYAQMTDEASSTGAKLTEFYDSLGIKTRDADGQLVDFYKVLEQMGEKWEELDDDQRKYYANIQAGANQSQNLLALLNNWGSARQINLTAKDAWDSDSAEKANENYMNSLEGKFNSLKSAWEQLSRDFMNSNFLKGLITIATKLLEIADHVGVVGTLLSLAFGYKMIWQLATFMESVGNLSGLIEKAGVSIALFGKESAVAGAEATASMATVGAEAEATTVKTITLGDAFKFLKANMVPIIGVAVAIAAVVGAIEIDKYFGLDESLKRMHEYEGQLDDVKGKIEELEKKRADGTITSAEMSQLKHLKAEERTLLHLIQLEERRAKKAAIKKYEQGSGKRHGERAGTEESATYEEAEAKYRSAKKDYDTLASQYAELEKKMKGSGLSHEEQLRMDTLEKEMGGKLENMDKYKAEMAEAGEALQESFEKGYESGARKKNMSAKGKANYDAARKSLIKSMLDPDTVQDDFEDVADTLTSMFDKLEGEVNAKDVNLLDTKTTLDGIKAIRKEARAGAEMSFDIKDKEGNSIKQVEGKLKDFTDEDLKILIDAEMTGDLSALENYEGTNESILNIKAQLNDKDAKKAESDLTSDKEVKVKAKSDKASFNKVENDEKNLTGTGEWTLKFKTTGYTDAIKQADNIKKKIPTGGSQYHFHATGKRKGEAGGLSWLGDEGSSTNPRPELVVTNDGAYLAGTTGWELHELKASDTVYSYADTKRMLGGRLATSGSTMMPRYAKGKKKSTEDKKREEFDRKLEALEYKRDIYHWSDKTFRDKYNALRKKYKKWLSVDQKRGYGRTNAEYLHDSASDTATRYTEAVSENGDAKKALDYIAKIRKAKKISAKEAKELRAEVYKNELDYYAREYSKGKKSYEDMYKVAKNYWAQVGKDTKNTKEYYESLDVLRQAEQERLEKKQEAYSDELEYGKAYVDYEIKQLEKQKEIVEKQKKQKEDAEELVDLQNELSKARSTMVRTYKEGVGWVYEADAKAIRDAQKNLDDYMDEHKTDSIQSQIDMWQEIADLFDDIAEQSELFALAQKLGVNNLYDLVKGDITDVETMANWIKGNNTWINAYDDMMTQLENMSPEEYKEYAEKGITDAMMNAEYDKFNFGNVLAGTLNNGNLSTLFENTSNEAYIKSVVDNIIKASSYVGMNKGEAQGKASESMSTTFNIDNISLPSVTDAKSFENSLKLYATQHSYAKALRSHNMHRSARSR